MLPNYGFVGFEKMIKSQLATEIDSRVLLAMVAKVEINGEKIDGGTKIW
jgi:hypothetical protein